MNGLALAAAVAIASSDSTARDSTQRRLPPDAWLGADKVKHALVAGFVYAGSESLARLAGASRRSALTIAIGPWAIASVGKEIRDRRVTGRFSGRDLVADAVGALAWSAMLARTAR